MVDPAPQRRSSGMGPVTMSLHPVEVRRVSSSDHAEWRRMRTALWPQAQSEHDAEMATYLGAADDAGAAVFVAVRAGGGLAGFVELRLRDFAEGCKSSPVVYVEGWWVDADVRRRRVGEALMGAAEDWARNHGIRELASDCDFDNQASLSAHLALGFSEAERVICLRKDL